MSIDVVIRQRLCGGIFRSPRKYLSDGPRTFSAGRLFRVTAPSYVAHVTRPRTIRTVPDCLFCAVVIGELPATLVLESDRTLAFRDINPQAPMHVLVIPKEHHENVAALAKADDGLLDEVIAQAHEVARAEGVSESGYRVVFNTGGDAGQTVQHVHAHVLGGRRLSWPPG